MGMILFGTVVLKQGGAMILSGTVVLKQGGSL